jgi:probable HAF family extracellular repeat protein/YD repeat-containing protein
MTTNFFDNVGRHYESAVPQALAWDARGRRIALVSRAKRSTAYDVADDGTVVGTLLAADGKHYAFRWREGHLERLDDLPHPPGWRFECAYSVATDGTIAGIGTHDGVATLFTWGP